MYHILNQVDNTEDLKKLNILEKQELAKDLRELVIDTVSKTGGHLASNLGVVEITIALHSVFNTPKDKIVWDVGHQTYIHKILTGRKNKISTLRSLNGLAGFPKAVESEYDAFDTGHSSTSISAALGMARARDIKGEKNSVIAVIGDGALTGGMAFEALNDTGSSNTNLIVILNDNEMSISKNVGGLSTFLTRIRTRKSYNKSNNYIKRITLRIPFIGKKIVYSDDKTLLKIEKDNFNNELGRIEKTIDESIHNAAYSEINLYYNHYNSSTSFEFKKLNLFPLKFEGEYYSNKDFVIETDITSMIYSLLTFYIMYQLRMCECISRAAENTIRNQITREAIDKIEQIEEEQSNELRKEKKTILINKTVDNYKKLSYMEADNG